MTNLKKFLIISVVFLISFNAQTQNDSTQSASLANQEILTGIIDRKELLEGEFGKSYRNEYQNYTPDQKILDKIKSYIFSYSVTIVMGTWCEDSQKQVPRFFKILDKLNYDSRFVKLICVDRSKKAEGIDSEDLNIIRIPTFIFYTKNSEKGRIIESPENTLEQDILKILTD